MTETAPTTGVTSGDPAATVALRSAYFRRVGLVVVAVPTLVVFLGLFVVMGPVAAAAAAAVAASAAAAWWRSTTSGGSATLLASFSTQPADPVRHARLANLTDGLSLVSGVARPELFVCEGDAPCAMVVASGDGSSVIVVTEGAVASWDRMESEAVLAHLLFRVRSGDAALVTTVLAWSSAAAKVGLGALAKSVLARVLDGAFVLASDVAACRATRYPPAMVSALEKAEAFYGDPGKSGLPSSLAPLWFAVPGNDTTRRTGFPSVGAFHPPLADRIALCKEI
jgi:heat shock protein HtpX